MPFPNENGPEWFSQTNPVIPPVEMETIETTLNPSEQAALELKGQYLSRLEAAASQVTLLDNSRVHEVYNLLAPELQENWQKAYIANPKNRTGDGEDDFLPRWKPAPNDLEWLYSRLTDPRTQRTVRFNPQTGEPEVDIARTEFHNLPPAPWIIQNYIAAMNAVMLIHLAVVSREPLDEAFLERASGHVHGAWVYRNPYVEEVAEDPTEEAVRAIQRLSYNHPNFTEEERNKDREHIVLATEAYVRILQRLKETPDAADTKRSNYAELFKQGSAKLGSAVVYLTGLMKRSEKSPKVTETLGEDIATISTAVQQLVGSWPEVGLATTDDGSFIRTYATRGLNRNNHFQARVTYKALNAQEVTGVYLEHYLSPYETYFYTSLPGDHQKKPSIYFGEEQYHSPDGPFASQENNETALRYANNLLEYAIRQTIQPTETADEAATTL